MVAVCRRCRDRVDLSNDCRPDHLAVGRQEILVDVETATLEKKDATDKQVQSGKAKSIRASSRSELGCEMNESQKERRNAF